jgi:hypothetical protein
LILGLSKVQYVLVVYINVRENLRSNQEWTMVRN